MENRITQLALLMVGIFTGAMLLIGVGLIPYWNSLPPLEFALWFSKNSHFLGTLMIPLGMSSTLVTIIAAAMGIKQRSDQSYWLAIAAFAAVSAAIIFPIHFVGANASIQSLTMTSTEIVTELEAWSNWHWLRTACATVAYIALVQSIFTSSRKH
ncbi:MAG: hypothetical protein V7765_06620 [Oleispira sp.]